MKNKYNNLKNILIGLVLIITLTITGKSQDTLELTKKQLRFLSNKTIKTHVMGLSTFNSFASYLYALDLANIYTDNPEVANTKLKSFPDPDREVTLMELFNEISKQTSSKWSFDKTHNCWLFSKPLPFEIDLAPGWGKEVRKGYIFYKPPSAPVGMDIYFAGSVDSFETTFEARNRVAILYAKHVMPNVILDSMFEVTLSNHKALFYKTVIKKNNIIWRQWAIVENNKCFVIESAIKINDEATVFPDVEKMVQSFKLINKEK